MTEKWTKIGVVAEIPEDGTLQCWVGEHAVCAYNLAGRIYVTDDACTHGEASLADGFIVDGTEIECSYHQGRFDIATGVATAAPCKVDLRVYPVRIIDGDILISLPSRTTSDSL